MKKTVLTICICLMAYMTYSQTAKDMVTASDVKVTWLGVDFSHVKLIGDFNQWGNGGEKSGNQIKEIYFPKWNELILNESEKYDLVGMLRKSKLKYDTGMITDLNDETPLEDLEADDEPDYTEEDIVSFVKSYQLDDTEGIGVVFIAEALNKRKTLAIYHFVAFNMSTKEVLIQERIESKPSGFGLRNYWGGSIYRTIKTITNTYYKKWKRKYG